MQISKRIAVVLALIASTVLVYAAASYPTSVVTFATRTNGQTIDASFFNTIQDEIVAIEGGLINGLAHDLKFTDGLFDIGKSGATRPRDLFLSRNATVGGTLAVTGATTFTGSTSFTGGVDLSGASSGQIVFPATQNASTNVNTLDDYEEGSWTPVLGGAGGTSGQTYTTQVGSYIKIGKRVDAEFIVVLSAKGTITGAVEIEGLPFASQNTTNVYGVPTISYFSAMTTNWIWIGGNMGPNTTVAGLYGTQAAATGVTALATADISNTTFLIGKVSYRAAN